MQVPIIGLSFKSEEFLSKFADLLSSDFSEVRLYLQETRDIPEDAYNKFRKQYLAERIFDYLRNEGIRLYVTDEPIYAKGSNFVFSEGEYRGPMLVSTHRLKPEFYDEEPDSTLLIERLRKEAIHALGHCFGLDDCENSNCAMSYSKSIKAVDRKDTGFCEECQVKISAQGLPIE